MEMIFLILLSLCASAYCICPDVQPVKNFDFSYYTEGKWYEIARYESAYEKDADCVVFDFVPDNNHEGVRIKEIVKNKATEIKSTMYPQDEPGKVLFGVKGAAVPENDTAYVVNTDNKNYAIFYFCIDGNPPTEAAWIVSRTPTISPELKASIDKDINEINVLKYNKLIWDKLTDDACKH